MLKLQETVTLASFIPDTYTNEKCIYFDENETEMPEEKT